MEMGQVRACPPREALHLLSAPAESLGKRPVRMGSPRSSATGVVARASSSQQRAWRTEGAPRCPVTPAGSPRTQREAPARGWAKRPTGCLKKLQLKNTRFEKPLNQAGPGSESGQGLYVSQHDVREDMPRLGARYVAPGRYLSR